MDVHTGRRGLSRPVALLLALVIAAVGCDRPAPTAVSAPPRIMPAPESPAVITREGRRLRIKLKKRQRNSIVAQGIRERTSVDRWSPPSGAIVSPPAARIGATSGTEAVSDLLTADTAIVSVSGRAELEARSSSFLATARLSARVLQGSWYPLRRSANGFDLTVSVVTATGLQEFGNMRRCMVETLIGVPKAQCMTDYSMTNSFATATGTEMSVGSACSYDAELYTKGMVSWEHNFDRDLSGREVHETAVQERASASIRRRCLPDPSEFCIDASLCETEGDGGGDAWLGDAATVEGEVEWTFSTTETGATNEVIVCEVTDWYQLIGTQWIYIETTVEACWLERR